MATAMIGEFLYYLAEMPHNDQRGGKQRRRAITI